MSKKLSYFGIIANECKDKDYELSKAVKEELEKLGMTCKILTKTGKDEDYTDGSKIPEEVECYIVIGGDGTMLAAVHDTLHIRRPMLGINLGTLGYLTAVDRSGISEALRALVSGEYEVEKRMMLEGCVKNREVALNDIVITRNGPLRTVNLSLYVNGQFLKSYSADGIIVSTPTGSTGYNMSAGGPILKPDSSMILVTPVCAHGVNNMSIVLAEGDVVEIEIGEKAADSEKETDAFFDGKHCLPLYTGDRITIKAAPEYTEMIRLGDLSFLDLLQRKMR